MRITNVHQLPAAIVEAVRNDPYPHGKTGDISATQLISPPQLVALKRLHEDDLEEDAADRIWALFGQSIHTILERSEPSAITECRLFGKRKHWTISGQADRIIALDEESKRVRIEDYKTTSAWSVLEGPKPEWVDQLHVLQWLAHQNGYQAEELAIIALLRDWSRGKALAGGGYPQAPVVTLRIPPLDIYHLNVWIGELVAAHMRAQDAVFSGRAPQPCTPEQRWQQPDIWAVHTPTRKSAVKLHDTPAAAHAHAAELKNAYVVQRPGTAVRCTSYCPVAGFCPQRQAELAADLDLAS